MSRASQERDIAQRLPMLTRIWRQLADALLVEFGVSNSTSWCLIWLDRLGPDVRQIDLAQAIGITQPSLVRLIDQLQQSGHVVRMQDPDDKRSNRVLLTDAGRELVGTIEARLRDERAILFDGISDADIETTLRLIDTLSTRIAERRV
ncbi:MarR family transcriptional regulator [Sphingomonas crocodyli]|uniref:MarR family transcriptional regulator n=2 Tax=Sphingomonas crocodyli TaxID=1979270 RepID=A0A437M837_9SPHN|nr:MarR family transcriptional regulator [Sphingomonas crocodyli]